MQEGPGSFDSRPYPLEELVGVPALYYSQSCRVYPEFCQVLRKVSSERVWREEEDGKSLALHPRHLRVNHRVQNQV